MKTRETLTTIALSFVTLHLFGTHARLLYYLNINKHLQDFNNAIPTFSFAIANEETITAMIFALAYSAMTAIILKLYDETAKLYVAAIATFAILDFLGVLIYYNTKIPNFNFCGALYYAFYTLATIAAIGYSRFQGNHNSQDCIARPSTTNTGNSLLEILRLKEEGVSQKQIALQLNMSESKVSRQIRNNNEN